MSETCNHDCGSCSANCASRQAPESFLEKANPKSSIRKIIGIVSGKGGVGKSLVTSLMAVAMQRRGYHSAVLDADITGPSIPKMFGIHGQAYGTDDGILPAVSTTGIQLMSVNLMLDSEETPVIWRGPILAGVVKQFYSEVIWSDVDVLFVDMPPGTGDVALTVLQSIPVNGVVMVSTPQPMVSMIVSKAVNMCRQLKIPVLGVVENMSYISCPNCGEKIALCQDSDRDEFLKQNELKLYGELPMTQSLMNINQEETFDARTLIEIEQLMEPTVKQLREDLGI